MTMDEGTPKRRRGLFRRDRPDEPAATEPRPSSSDGFDDPWSASAWDDWDDDFTAGGQRSSVPAAAAPRPEAVDAWLQSEANDFDDAARKNTKRWGGDANRAATGATGGADGSVGAGGFGLAARLRTFDQSPASSFSTDAVPAATPRAAASAASSISPAVEPRPVIDTSAEMWMEQPSTPSSIEAPTEAPIDPAAEPVEAPIEPAHIDPGPQPVLVDPAAEPVELDPVPQPALVDPVPQPALVDPTPRPAHATLEDDEDDLVDDLSMVDDDDDDDDAVAPAAPQRTIGDRQTRLPDSADQLFALTDDDQSSATAPLAPPAPLATLDSGAPTAELDRATASEDDEWREIDRLDPDPDDDADLRTLDEELTSAAPPAASWAPSERVLPAPVSAIPLAPTDALTDAPTPPASPVPQPRHQPPQRQQPEPQPQPHQQDQPNEIAAAFSPADTIAGGSASRFVSVSVVTDDDRAAAVLPAAETGTPPYRPERFAPAEFIQSEPGEVAPPTPGLTTSATGSPRSTSRWAQLSAEFDSDGDLDDSFPRPPSAPPGRRPTALTDAAVTPATPATPFTDVAAPTTPITEIRTQTQPIEQPASIDQPRPTAEHATAEHAITDSDEDPWRRPSPRTPRPVSPPAEARSQPTSATSAPSPTAADTDDPWARPPVSRTNTPAESSRPPRRPDPAAAPPYLGEQAPDATDTPARKPRRTRNVESPGIVETSRASEAYQSVDVAQGEDATARPTLLHPDLSTFAGVIGSALVAFAAVRLILTLVGTQPAVPAQFTGTKADFLRIGESFAKSGTTWPVALIVGTVLLVLPGFLGVRGHLRRWAPILGIALATGLGAIIVGYLRISSGLELKTASTLKLVSDAIVGPIGFGLITVVSVAFAVRAAQANPPH